ncbi:MAG: Polymer-forming cytoskeletal [Saliniramus fredricksonii]|uniref:Polymer-forming cytoskeletal n=1 Tax=Saliniramus fredricksonii TaxID=1653334 RepID=A0A0N8KEN0_9HYPH|nr:polymer-forming cytoskeletal protein [Saliniramus fredricksonii]KPQ11794.1 MAG: Polymer-forming cytoskeletal [Saliniramus fredricksonii]SCC82281.1 hypothetical protein GA0071312_3262 [Saliniramus fredricksonii]
MAEISGQLEGPLTLECDLVMRGRVKGTVTVPSGSRLDLEGVIMGDLVVEEGGAAIVHGAVAGTLVNHGGDVEVRGTVNCVHDYGDRLTRFGRDAKVGFDRARTAKTATGPAQD